MNPLSVFDEPLQNEWLALLPRSEFTRLRPLLEVVDLKKGDILWEAGDPRQYLYFPLNALVGLTREFQDGDVIEIGFVGRKGMAGVLTFLGTATMRGRAFVHREGRAYRMQGKRVELEFARNSVFRNICLRYTEIFMTNLAIDGICNRLHSVEQQICKYLLTHQDNVDSKFVKATHLEISNILGVQRSSVSTILIDLRNRGLITYRRGEITLRDRQGMEKIVCKCYLEITKQYNQAMADHNAIRGNENKRLAQVIPPTNIFELCLPADTP